MSNIHFLIFRELSLSSHCIHTHARTYVLAPHSNRLNIGLRPRSGKEVKLVITYLINLLPCSQSESSLARNRWAKKEFLHATSP